MKKALAISLVFCMLFALCACVSVTTTNTETVTENGVTTTTTTTTNNGVSSTETTQTVAYPDGSCGAVAGDGETHPVSVSIENATGEDITGFYCKRNGTDDWTALFDDGDILEDGMKLNDCMDINYTADTMSWDMGIEDANGEDHVFEDIDISDLDANGFTITFSKDGDSYYWDIDASYVK